MVYQAAPKICEYFSCQIDIEKYMQIYSDSFLLGMTYLDFSIPDTGHFHTVRGNSNFAVKQLSLHSKLEP